MQFKQPVWVSSSWEPRRRADLLAVHGLTPYDEEKVGRRNLLANSPCVPGDSSYEVNAMYCGRDDGI